MVCFCYEVIIFPFKMCSLFLILTAFFLRLWKDVTASLKVDDVEKATASKHKVFYYPYNGCTNKETALSPQCISRVELDNLTKV